MSAVKVDCGCKFTITQTVYPSGCKLENVNSPFVSPNSSVSSVNLAAHQDSTFPFATAISIWQETDNVMGKYILTPLESSRIKLLVTEFRKIHLNNRILWFQTYTDPLFWLKKISNLPFCFWQLARLHQAHPYSRTPAVWRILLLCLSCGLESTLQTSGCLLFTAETMTINVNNTW